FSGSWAQVTLTQTPNEISATPGQTVTISCKSSASTSSAGVGSYLNWFQQKPQQPPKLLIYYADTRQSGIPDRFSGSGLGINFTLTITDIKDEDAAVYYCQHALGFYIHTVIQSRTKTSFLF
ncbi:unnamed protein product, partial [Staurois parvus]